MQTLDDHLLNPGSSTTLFGFYEPVLGFLYFGVLQARFSLFAGLFFAAVFSIPRPGLWGAPRDDALPVIALTIQPWMFSAKLETLDGLKAITISHPDRLRPRGIQDLQWNKVLRLAMFCIYKKCSACLFSGFMDAAVGSDITPSWGLLGLRVPHHPPHWMTWSIAALIYLDFFTHQKTPAPSSASGNARINSEPDQQLILAIGVPGRCW